MKKIPIIVTAAYGLGYVSLINWVKKNPAYKIIGTSYEKDSPGFAFVDKGFVIPKAGEPGYLEELLKICKKEKIKVLFPADGKEIFILASNLEKFENIGTKVIVSPLDSLHQSEDRLNFFSFCKKNDVPFPKFTDVKSYDQFEKAVQAFGYPKKEVCFKPKISSGSRGFRVLSVKDNRLHQLIHEQPGNVKASFSEISEILKTAEKFPEILVMEFLPGQEYSVDCLVNHGKAQIIVPRSRGKTVLGTSFTGEVINDKEIIKYTKIIAEGLNLHGIVQVQFRKDEKGVPKVLEVNTRVPGGIMLTCAAGVNMPDLAIKNALGITWKMPKIKWKTKLIRYYYEVYKDPKNKFFKCN